MPRMFGLVDTKVQEAEYFLDRILEADLDFFAVRCDAVAFAASARSITFAMQSSLKGIPQFDDWYSRKQSEIKNDPLCRFFNEFRRVSQHIGENAVVGGRYKGNTSLFFFGPTPELPTVPDLDVAAACTEYFKTTLQLVFECYITFPTLINGQWRYTNEHYATLGKTIQDAEEDLGLARGWTAVSGYDEDTCWRYLRRQADGCNIQQQFEEWLGKRVPYPDDEI